jgi:hypothetical protein
VHKISGVLCLLTFANIHPLSANIVSNWSFEEPVLQVPFEYFPSIPGWSLASGPSIELQQGFNGPSFEGLQHVELDSEANSAIYQDLVTAPGAYRLSFAFSPRPGWGENTMEVFWNGTLLDTLDGDGLNLASTNWTVHTYLVTATGPSTRLQFAAAGTSDSFGAYLDGVEVETVIPEPASTALCVVGLVGLAALRYKKKAGSNSGHRS